MANPKIIARKQQLTLADKTRVVLREPLAPKCPFVQPTRSRKMIHAAFSPVPLRQVLLSRVAALVGATVILVAAGFVVFGLIPMADRMAEDQFDTATMRIETGLNSAFSPTTALLAMSRNWLAGEAPDLNSPDAFNRLFQPVLEISPQITSVVAGTSSGQGWLLLQQPGGSWRNRMTDIPRWGERHLFIDR